MTLSPFALHAHQSSNLVVMIVVMFAAVVKQTCLLLPGSLALAVAPSQQVAFLSAVARRGRYGLVAAS